MLADFFFYIYKIVCVSAVSWRLSLLAKSFTLQRENNKQLKLASVFYYYI